MPRHENNLPRFRDDIDFRDSAPRSAGPGRSVAVGPRMQVQVGHSLPDSAFSEPATEQAVKHGKNPRHEQVNAEIFHEASILAAQPETQAMITEAIKSPLPAGTARAAEIITDTDTHTITRFSDGTVRCDVKSSSTQPTTKKEQR